MEAARRSPLFAGIADRELEPLLKCLQAQKRAYPRGSLIVSEGETVTQLGIVLSGRVYTVYEDTFGGRSIISTIEPGQNFCDAYACTAGQHTPVSVSAKTDCTVLMMKVQKVRKSGLTFAPEAGTQRLRDAINKNVTEEEILTTCATAFSGGWNSVKLYFMYL